MNPATMDMSAYKARIYKERKRLGLCSRCGSPLPTAKENEKRRFACVLCRAELTKRRAAR